MSLFQKLVCLWLISSFSVQAFAKTDVLGVRLQRSPDGIRVVFDMSGPATHKVFPLSSPDRVVLDINNATMSADLSALNLIDSPISSIRFAKKGKSDIRVVLDMSQSTNVRSFPLKKSGDAKDRLVLDLLDANSIKSLAKTKKTVHEIKKSQRDIIIAIDAGHGGEDPGAIGPQKIYEKTVVLNIAKQLKILFDKTRGYKAILVRTGDYYIPLAKRRDLARKANADMFVSIHADAFSSPKAHGTSVYALSSRGATSASARFLADKENKSDLVGGVSLNDMDAVLSSVLLDLSMTHKVQASLEIGEHVLRHMGGISRLHSKRVEQAAFAVLKTPDIPSLLIETGFISNPGEAKKLSTRAYRGKMANAIFQGVSDWFLQNATEDTYIAQSASKRKINALHIVSGGDTLSGVASRYGVSIASLKKQNKLRSSGLRIGQRLTIPK